MLLAFLCQLKHSQIVHSLSYLVIQVHTNNCTFGVINHILLSLPLLQHFSSNIPVKKIVYDMLQNSLKHVKLNLSINYK